MIEENVQRVIDVFTKVIDEYAKDFTIVYTNEAEKDTFLYKTLKTKLDKWKTSRKCIYSSCNKMSVRRSHTIGKSNNLRIICEDGKLLTPFFGNKTGKLSIREIGLNEASTFPGFCNEHEQLFSKFEKTGELKDSKDFQLQIYRTICREILVKELFSEHFERILADYRIFRDKKLIHLIKERLGKEFVKNNSQILNTMKLTECDTYIENMILDKIKKFKEDLNELRNEFLHGMIEDLKNSEAENIYAVAISLDLIIPVALAGRGNFIINDSAKSDAVMILNVFPYESGTYFIIASLKKYKKSLDSYIDYYKQHPLLLLNMVENWMVHGSDHWFIKPSVWYNIKDEVKEKILEEIFDTSKNVGFPFDYSLLNTSRKYIFNLMDYDTFPKKIKEFFETEKMKIYHSNI